ncbi:MAG: helix-hairpin-helix domain-containing protein, partial [Bdellovibrionota bacterium]
MTALELLEDIRRLMQLKGENPFKVRAFERAIGELAGREDLAERAKAGTLTEIDGIGKGISEVLTDFLVHQKTTVLDELKKNLPTGLVELTEIPGLGPKKAMQLIEELGIQSVAELEYACNENRLLQLKGFGPKVQTKILEGIQFQKASAGRSRLVDALPVAEALASALAKALPGMQVSETGAIRRRCEIVSELEFLIEGAKSESKAKSALAKFEKTQAGML